MKALLSILFFFIIVINLSCHKEAHKMVYASVREQGGCTPGAWLVEIENADYTKQSFICKPPDFVSAVMACEHSVYIVNLPDQFKSAGKKIKFSKWEEVVSCLSSSVAPHHIEVKNVSAN
jgi:hypothetical protein